MSAAVQHTDPLATLAADLWARHAAGDLAARDQLVRDNLGLVYHIAQRLTRTVRVRVELDELVSAGTLGLMQALDAFDPARGRAFSTFAVRRIRGAMLDELRRLDHAPRATRRKARVTTTAREELAQTLGRRPTHAEVASHLGVDGPTLSRWQHEAEAARQFPLHAPALLGHEGQQLADALPAGDDEAGVEDALEREHEVGVLRTALLRLPEKQRTVLALYYFEELTLAQIGTVLGRTESRVSQLRSQALATLRATLRGPSRQAA